MNSALMLHRHARPAVAGSYTLGAIGGACTTGGALFVLGGLVSPIPASVRGTIAVCGLLLLLLRTTGWVCIELPQRKYQIPRETFSATPTAAAFRFAFELGTGVRTYITATAPYAIAVILLLVLPIGLWTAALAALATAVGYGLGRSVIVAVQSLRSTIAVEHPKHWLRAADLVAVATALALAVRFLANA